LHNSRLSDNRKRRVKESKMSNLSPLAPRAPQGARYRYFSNPPTAVSLRLADIASQIPEAARLPAFNGEHSVELPCEDVFTGPAPKLLLSRLAEIAREHVRLDGVQDLSINLPAARLALGYYLINGRELLEEPGENETPRKISHPSEEFASKGDISETEESPLDEKRDVAPPKCEAQSEEAKSPPRVVVPLADPVAPSLAVADARPVGSPIADAMAQSVTAKVPPDAVESSAPLSPEQPAPVRQENPSSTVPESPPTVPRTTPVPETWRPISIFPIFRRKGVEADMKPPATPPHVEFRKPRAPFVPLEFSSGPPQPVAPEGKAVEPEPQAVEQPTKELALAAPAQEAILVETEHLPRSESKHSTEIPDQDALQALFMTEEFLSVDRVVELCGGLPGIKSCVLAHGSAVLASHNVPESIDLVSLSAHALDMLAAMRQSAARMGIGAVPAVTIHSEKGPITFFQHDDLCLLVLHKDRGFVPGVREKLQQVVEHLSEANLALSVGASRPALAQKGATF
jgi:predicted regulator of Ras-like GTPase activity (Roadblock/LC7/MglB family)